MALSRSMKNLMHDSAMARRGGGNPNPSGGGMSGMLSQAMQQARGRYNPGGTKPTPGGNRGPRGPVKPAPSGGRFGGRNPETGGVRGPVLRPSPGRTPMTGGPRGPAGQQALMKAKMQQARQRGAGGGMMRPAVEPIRRGPGTVAGKPMPRGGTFGFASRGGGGTPALQQRAAPRPGGLPGAISGAQQQAAMQRARPAAPAALAQPRGQTTAQRIGGRQGPPASRGGMARALGSGGSRRRMLR